MKKQSDIRTELRPHQERVVRRIQDPRTSGLVVAHGLGSGKTLSAIAASEALGGGVDVIVPSALQPNFQKELDKHVADPASADYSIESIERVARGEGLEGADVLIVDEAHRLRNPKSKARRQIQEAANRFGKRLLLTATPVYNKPFDIAAPINIAAGENVLPADLGGFNKEFIHRETVRPGLFARIFSGAKPGVRETLKNERKLREIFEKYVDYQENSTEGFPSRIDEIVEVPMAKKQFNLYRYAMNEAPASIRHKIKAGLPPSKQESRSLNTFLTAARKIGTSPGSYDTRITSEELQENSPKLHKAFERFQERAASDPDHRAVIYANFLDGIGQYRKMLDDSGVPYGVFTGSEKKRDRDQAVRDYNDGKLKALFLSSAGGEGLDLKGTRQIQVLEPHFNDEKLEQVIGRGIRFGSHADLPEDRRDVTVEHYLSTLPERRGIGRLFRGRNRGGSVDQYLTQLSADKRALGDRVRDLMAEATSAHKTSMNRRMAYKLRQKTSYTIPEAILFGAGGIGSAFGRSITPKREDGSRDPFAVARNSVLTGLSVGAVPATGLAVLQAAGAAKGRKLREFGKALGGGSLVAGIGAGIGGMVQGGMQVPRNGFARYRNRHEQPKTSMQKQSLSPKAALIGAAAIPTVGFISGALAPSRTLKGKPSSRLTAERGKGIGAVAGATLGALTLHSVLKRPGLWGEMGQQIQERIGRDIVRHGPLAAAVAGGIGGGILGSRVGAESSRIGARIPEASRRRRKYSVDVRTLQRVLNQAYPRTRVPRRDMGGVLSQALAPNPSIAKVTEFRDPSMRKLVRDLNEVDESMPGFSASKAYVQGVPDGIYSTPGNQRDGIQRGFDLVGPDMLPLGRVPRLPELSGQGHRAFNAVTHAHEGMELQAARKVPALTRFNSHLDPSVITAESHLLASLTGPGAQEAREAYQVIRRAVLEADIYEEAVRRVTGGRGDYARYGEARLPKSMRKRVSEEMRRITRDPDEQEFLDDILADRF